jgi:hypothetical protein
VVDPYDVLGLATAPTTEPPAPYAAHAFRMPSTGETILLLSPNF